MSEKQVAEFYNIRGELVRRSSISKAMISIGVVCLSFLEGSTVYLTIMAMAHIVYKWVLYVLGQLVGGLT